MAEIKKINVDGVDYDIVSESAEKKIAELEKNNTALASVTFGTRNDFGDPIKVGLGALPENSEVADIMIGKGTRIGESVLIGSQYPVSMGWDHDGSFFIKSNGGNRGSITIGSNISLSMYGDAAELRNDREGICRLYAHNCEIRIGSATVDKGLIVNAGGSQVLEIGNAVYIGNSLTIGSNIVIGDHVHIGSYVSIGKNLSSEEHLHIQGPVYIKAETGVRGLTIGTDGIGIIKISWAEADKIVFTDVTTGKKATLTLS